METIEANLLDFPVGITHIFHQCNIRKTFGAGIALQIKKRYPEAFQADVDFPKYGTERFGEFSRTKLSGDAIDRGFGGEVVNLYAQDLGGNLSESVTPFRSEFYRKALGRFLDTLEEDRENDLIKGLHIEPVLGFPKLIGCGLAGGDWDEVKEMTEELVSKYTAYWVDFKQ